MCTRERERDREGNQAILVAMDSFSKFMALLSRVEHNFHGMLCAILECRYFNGLRNALFRTMPGILCQDIVFLLSMAIKWIYTPFHPRVLLQCEDLHLQAFAFNTACLNSKFSPARLFLGRAGHEIWDLGEANASKDLEEEKCFWAEAIRNLTKATDQVVRRYNAARKVTTFRVRDMVVYRMTALSSKGKGVSAQLELKWSKPMTNHQILHNQPTLTLVWCLRKLM
jgi:hypothetical protein